MLFRNSPLVSDAEKEVFKAELRTFLKEQEEAERCETGILGGSKKVVGREEAFAHRLAREFFQRKTFSEFLSKAVDEDPNSWEGDPGYEYAEFDVDEYREDLEVEAEIYANLAYLFQSVAENGVERAV